MNGRRRRAKHFFPGIQSGRVEILYTGSHVGAFVCCIEDFSSKEGDETLNMGSDLLLRSVDWTWRATGLIIYNRPDNSGSRAVANLKVKKHTVRDCVSIVKNCIDKSIKSQN